VHGSRSSHAFALSSRTQEPAAQRSVVHGFASSHSASRTHSGSVVVVVEVVVVVVVSGAVVGVVSGNVVVVPPDTVVVVASDTVVVVVPGTDVVVVCGKDVVVGIAVVVVVEVPGHDTPHVADAASTQALSQLVSQQ
jgi:hypothetical protein